MRGNVNNKGKASKHPKHKNLLYATQKEVCTMIAAFLHEPLNHQSHIMRAVSGLVPYAGAFNQLTRTGRGDYPTLRICDVAAGDGRLSKALVGEYPADKDIHVTGIELEPFAGKPDHIQNWLVGDFLTMDLSSLAGTQHIIISNPPFTKANTNLWVPFAKKSLSLLAPGGVMAFYGRSIIMETKNRCLPGGIMHDSPPTFYLPIIPRAQHADKVFTDKKSNSYFETCWYIWVNGYTAPTLRAGYLNWRGYLPVDVPDVLIDPVTGSASQTAPQPRQLAFF